MEQSPRAVLATKARHLQSSGDALKRRGLRLFVCVFSMFSLQTISPSGLRVRTRAVRLDVMCWHVRACRLSNHPYEGGWRCGGGAEPLHATDSLCLSCHHIEREPNPPPLPLPYAQPTRLLLARDARKCDRWRAAWM